MSDYSPVQSPLQTGQGKLSLVTVMHPLVHPDLTRLAALGHCCLCANTVQPVHDVQKYRFSHTIFIGLYTHSHITRKMITVPSINSLILILVLAARMHMHPVQLTAHA